MWWCQDQTSARSLSIITCSTRSDVILNKNWLRRALLDTLIAKLRYGHETRFDKRVLMEAASWLHPFNRSQRSPQLQTLKMHYKEQCLLKTHKTVQLDALWIVKEVCQEIAKFRSLANRRLIDSYLTMLIRTLQPLIRSSSRINKLLVRWYLKTPDKVMVTPCRSPICQARRPSTRQGMHVPICQTFICRHLT